MAHLFTDDRFPFAAAAAASGASPKALRNWIDRGQITLIADEERKGGGWRRFSFLDIAKLALVGRMVAWGMSVERADVIAMGAFPNSVWIPLVRKGASLTEIIEALAGAKILVWRNVDGWDGGYVRAGKAPPGHLPDTVLSIDLDAVLDEVLDNLVIASRTLAAQKK